MKKVLILAYYFPPLGMGGTQRAAKFAKYLPEFGWEPVVITVKDVAYYTKDPSLLEEVKDINIFRTGSWDPQRILALLKGRGETQAQEGSQWSGDGLIRMLNNLIGSWLLIPDSKILWIPFALAKSFKIICKKKIRAIFTTSPPHSVHLTGFLLKKLTGVQWVADFRDGWTEGEFQPCPTAVHLGLNRMLEREILRSADKVIGVSHRLTEALMSKSGCPPEKFVTITNGYDGEDFKGINSAQEAAKFTIIHNGAVSAISDPEPFLVALGSLLKENKDLREKLVCKFVGMSLNRDLGSLIAKNHLEEVVEVAGYLSHRESLRRLMGSHLLLLLISKKSGKGFIPGKTFEYLASGRPILAIAPQGETVELIRSLGKGTVVDNGDIQSIKEATLKYFRYFQEGKLPSAPANSLPQFERRNLTGKLASILDDTLKR